MEKLPQPSFYEKYTLAIIPMGIPAIGKSKIFEQLMKLGEPHKIFQFDFVSSDDIKKACIDKYQKDHPEATTEIAFNSTQGSYKASFAHALKVAAENLVPGKVHCIIVDKNHPGNGFNVSIQ